MPSQEHLRACFDYDTAGELISKRSLKPVGARQGAYRSILIPRWHKRQFIRLHRAIWIWHNGPIPDGMMVDHIDRDTLNNRIENLRLATPRLNACNRTPKNGALGLSWSSGHKAWRANVVYEGRVIFLGQSKDKHRLIWLLHLYRTGLYHPLNENNFTRRMAPRRVSSRPSRVTAQLMSEEITR